MRTLTRVALAGILGVSALAGPSLGASAAVGSGTFTKITTPAHTVTKSFTPGGTNTLQVSGVTSLDVTQVDIDCVTGIIGAPNLASHFATAVPVTSGSFSVAAVFPGSPPTNCRLRAVPVGVDPTTDYLGAYSGPILYTNAFGENSDASDNVYGFFAQNEEGDGVAVVADAGSCGTQALVTVEAPQMIASAVLLTCLFSLPAGNIGPSGPSTHSSVQVDGHDAYLPAGVHDFLIGSQGLPLTQPLLGVTRSVAGNGDVTITESAPLMRCSVSDVYPPTGVSCPSLVSTGVRFHRVTTFWRNGHQAKIRDTFASVDGAAHSVGAQYFGAGVNETAGGTATGSVGYSFPRHSGSFLAASLGETVTGFGKGAGSLLIRSDLHAGADDPQADTVAGTWSRPPSKVIFHSAAQNEFGMAYRLAVPGGGVAFLGFGYSERWSTVDAKTLATLAVRDMVVAPTITSPHQGATVHGRSTTVKGVLKAGANGLPTSVNVNGHAAKIIRTGSASATYRVTFKEALGRHRIKVVARDSVGTKASASIRVTNT